MNTVMILKEQTNDPEAQEWAKCLFALYKDPVVRSGYRRFDLVSYICGKHPVTKSTWMSQTTPHPKYTIGRVLECVEIHIDNVDALVKEVYEE